MKEAKAKNISMKILRDRLAKFAVILGLELSDNSKIKYKREFCAINQLILYLNILLALTLILHEHAKKCSNFLGDCQTMIIASGQLLVTIGGLICYCQQRNIRKLLDWCQEKLTFISLKTILLFKLMDLIFKLAYFCPIIMASIAFLVNIIFNKRKWVIPLYEVTEINDNLMVFYVLFILQSLANAAFLIYGCCMAVIFVISVTSLSVQYTVLDDKMAQFNNFTKSLKVLDQKLIQKELQVIGLMHSDLLNALELFDTIFSVIMFLSEMYCRVGSVVAATIIMYQPQEFIFALFIMGTTLISTLGPILGQEVTSNAEYFAETVYEADWEKISKTNRKELSFMLMMAQKEVGISSAGFHFSNYYELSQVHSLYGVIINS